MIYLKKISILILILISFDTFAQQDKYIVFLKDKNNSPYSENQPLAFLSQKSIDRRAKNSTPVTEQDFPVNPAYLTGISSTGAQIINRSRWFNAVTVIADTSEIINVGALSYVNSYQKVFGTNIPKGNNPTDKFKEDILKYKSNFDTTLYGPPLNHMKVMNGLPVHDAGFTGQAMTIAVLDDGFRLVDVHPVFNEMIANGRIKGTWDFVENNSFVYDYDGHGTAVLGLMGGYIPGEYIGTAPMADYYLLRTEDVVTEYMIEEWNWVSGAEFADSVGADVINSSLGYTEFDALSQNFTYNDMNGVTAPATIAADIAFSKGILVCLSAGNSGNNSWFYISSPADALNSLTVGACGIDRNIASFSSHGPTFDGRIKPNVTGMGFQCYVAGQDTGFHYGSGTSYSSPVIAGMSASLWGVNPDLSNADLKEIIEASSDRFLNPDNTYGYGIPDYEFAYQLVLATIPTTGLNTKQNSNALHVFPNPFNSSITFRVMAGKETNATMNIYDTFGKLVISRVLELIPQQLNEITEPNLNTLQPGMYMIRISNSEINAGEKMVKN